MAARRGGGGATGTAATAVIANFTHSDMKLVAKTYEPFPVPAVISGGTNVSFQAEESTTKMHGCVYRIENGNKVLDLTIAWNSSQVYTDLQEIPIDYSDYWNCIAGRLVNSASQITASHIGYQATLTVTTDENLVVSATLVPPPSELSKPDGEINA